MSSWNELANSGRWRGVVSFLNNWDHPLDSSNGMNPEELDTSLSKEIPNLPTAVREWYLLAGGIRWGVVVWIKPEHLQIKEDRVLIITDDHGVTEWYIRVSDFHLEDPPIVSDTKPDGVACSHFSKFITLLIVNEFIFANAEETYGEPLELNPESARANLKCLATSDLGGLLADAPLESATIVASAYSDRTYYGKSRTPEGRALLRQMQIMPQGGQHANMG